MRSGFNIFISLLGLCDSLEFFQWKWEISRGGMRLFGGGRECFPALGIEMYFK